MSAKDINRKENKVWQSGGRKSASARIILEPGKGNFLINDKKMSDYFPQEEDQQRLIDPFTVTGLDLGKFDISIKVSGGGVKGQLDACRHSLSRSLLEFQPDLRSVLKSAGLLTRDSRKKERKKYGLRKARRAPQFSKR